MDELGNILEKYLEFLQCVKTGTKKRNEINFFKKICLSFWMMKSNFNKFEIEH